MHILAELQPFDPVAGTRVTLRVASANDAAITGLNDQIWWAAMIKRPSFGIRIFKGDFDGQTTVSAGSIGLSIVKLLELNPNARRLIWAGAPVKLYAGNSGQAWPWVNVLNATALLTGRDGLKLDLSLKVDSTAFEADVLTVKYAGTGGAEGGDDLKDKWKPIVYGRCFNIEPVLIDPVYNVYQVSGYGAIDAIPKVYERGSEFPAAVANYANYAALIAATVANGQWATCLAEGMFRLGAPSYGIITADVDGDKNGGTWRRKTGEICLRILAASSVSGTLIESVSFTGLDTALAGLPNQGRIGDYITDQVSCIDKIAELCAPCNAQSGVSLLGKIFVTRPLIGMPTLTLDVQRRQEPRVTASKEVSVTEPYSYMEFGYARSWRAHTEDEIATASSPEPGADRTITSQVTPSPPDDVIINATYTGTIITSPSQFNKVLTPSLIRNGSSVRTDNRATYSVTDITSGLTGFVSVNNTTGNADKGRVTITNATATGSFKLNISWDGVLIASYLVRLTVVSAAPPSGGGGGGGGGSKSGTASVAGWGTSSTSYAEVARVSGLTKATGETIKASLPVADYELSYSANSTRNMVAKFQYSVAGAESWTDFGSGVSGSSSTFDATEFFATTGTITVNQNATPSDNDYDVRLVAAVNAAGGGGLTFNSGEAMSVIIEP